MTEEGVNPERPSRNQKKIKDDCLDTWVEVMRLHLEQDNLNDKRQACIAILSNLEGTDTEMRGSKERGGA